MPALRVKRLDGYVPKSGETSTNGVLCFETGSHTRESIPQRTEIAKYLLSWVITPKFRGDSTIFRVGLSRLSVQVDNFIAYPHKPASRRPDFSRDRLPGDCLTCKVNLFFFLPPTWKCTGTLKEHRPMPEFPHGSLGLLQTSEVKSRLKSVCALS